MKKIFLMMYLAIGFSQISTAQIQFGLKGGINYNSNSITEVNNNVLEGAEGKNGYHAGIWLRAKIPVLGVYIRPEIVYTNLESEFTFKGAKSSKNSIQKIDVPVLIGKKIFGIGTLFVGPSFQYVLKSNFTLSDVKDTKTTDFTMGIQFGGGVEFGKLGIDVRWERSLSSLESSFLNATVSTGRVNYDTRINQIIIGLSYRL